MKAFSNTLIKLTTIIFIIAFAISIISFASAFILTLKERDFYWTDWIGFLCYTVSAVAIGFWIRWAMF